MGFDVAGGDGDSDAKTDSRQGRRETGRQAKAKPRRPRRRAKSIPAPVADVGEETFDLLPKGANLWVKNAARESALIAEMKKGDTLEVKAAVVKGGDIDRLLFAVRLLPGDGPPAEGMPGQGVSLVAPPAGRGPGEGRADRQSCAAWRRPSATAPLQRCGEASSRGRSMVVDAEVARQPPGPAKRIVGHAPALHDLEPRRRGRRAPVPRA